MDTLDEKIEREITPKRRRELEEYTKHQGLKLTKREHREMEEAWKAPVGPERDEPTAEEIRAEKEETDGIRHLEMRMESYAPRIAIEFLYVDRVKLRLQEDKTQDKENQAADIALSKIQTSISAKKPSVALSKKRAQAAKQNRAVKDNGDRTKIKTAVLRKEKQGYTSNQAHNEVASLSQSNANLLKLKEGPYTFISARTVRRIAKGK